MDRLESVLGDEAFTAELQLLKRDLARGHELLAPADKDYRSVLTLVEGALACLTWKAYTPATLEAQGRARGDSRAAPAHPPVAVVAGVLAGAVEGSRAWLGRRGQGRWVMGMSFGLALAFGLLGALAVALVTSGQIPPGHRDALAVLGALLGAILGAVIGGTEAIVHALSNRQRSEPPAPRRGEGGPAG